MGIPYLVFGASVFVVLWAVFYPADGLSLAEATVDAVRSKIIDYLERGDNKRKLEILGTGPEKYIRQGFLLGVLIGVLLFLLTAIKIHVFAILFIFAGAGAGLLLSDLAIKQQYSKWQDGIVLGVPVLVDFLPAFLEIRGVTVRDALAKTVDFLPEPLRGELDDAVRKIRQTGDARGVLDRLSGRAKHPVMSAVCARLATAWDSVVTPEIFLDLRQEIDSARELSATKATNKMKAMLALIVVIGLVGLIFIGLYPAGIWLKTVLAGTFGGG